MGAYFVEPKAFTISSIPALSTAPAANLAVDHPGRVWKSPSSASITIDITGDGSTIDTIALVGSDLTALETIQVKTGTNAGTAISVGSPVVAFEGFKPSQISTITVIEIPPQPFNFVRLIITPSAARSIQAQRLVIGSRVSSDGIDYDAEMSFEDKSVDVGGISYSAFEIYPTLAAWKVSMSGISESDWRTKWFPLLKSVGNNKGVLFNPDDISNWQSDRMFGRISSTASAKLPGWNNWKATVSIRTLV